MNILYEAANHNFLKSIVNCGVWTCFLMIKVKLSILAPIIMFLSGIQKRWNQVRLTGIYITFRLRLKVLRKETKSITKVPFKITIDSCYTSRLMDKFVKIHNKQVITISISLHKQKSTTLFTSTFNQINVYLSLFISATNYPWN